MKTFKLSINQKLIRPKVNVLFGYSNTRLLNLAFPLGGRWTDRKVRADEGGLIKPPHHRYAELLSQGEAFLVKRRPHSLRKRRRRTVSVNAAGNVITLVSVFPCAGTQPSVA